MRVKECERYTCLRRCRLVVSASTFIASKLICFARLCVNLVQPFHQCTVSLCVLYLLQVENASDFDIRLPAALSRDPRGTTDSDEQRSRHCSTDSTGFSFRKGTHTAYFFHRFDSGGRWNCALPAMTFWKKATRVRKRRVLDRTLFHRVPPHAQIAICWNADSSIHRM